MNKEKKILIKGIVKYVVAIGGVCWISQLVTAGIIAQYDNEMNNLESDKTIESNKEV